MTCVRLADPDPDREEQDRRLKDPSQRQVPPWPLGRQSGRNERRARAKKHPILTPSHPQLTNTPATNNSSDRVKE
jgi:hypothetical protein